MLLPLWNKCNNNCIMCSNPEGYQDNNNSLLYSKELIIDKIKKNKLQIIKTKDVIHFTGGEPTIHPEFIDIIKWVRGNFNDNKIIITTNGRRFFYKSFTDGLLKIKNLNLQIAIHGYDDKTHDSVTRVRGSFEQTIRGIKNLMEYKNLSHKIEIRIILTRKNYKIINKIYERIFKLFPSIDIIVLIFNEIEGRCKDNLNEVGITHKECKEFVQDCSDFWGRKFKDFRLYHFPLCTLDFKYWKYMYRTLPEDEVSFLKSCDECLYKKYCLGIHFGYLKAFDEGEFVPIKKNIKLEINNNFYRPIINVFE